MGFFQDIAYGFRSKQDERYDKSTAERGRYSAKRAKGQANEHLALARKALEDGDDDEAIRQAEKGQDALNLYEDIETALLFRKW